MQTFTLDPMLDTRWDDLVASHPKASVFHHRGWLAALATTYGYRPIVLTTTPPGQPLSDGIAFCEVESWITGNRLVSLPFADHSAPLLGESGNCSELAGWMRDQLRDRSWRYIELRPLVWEAQTGWPLAASKSFWFHTLDLTAPLDHIFRKMDKSSIQRRVQRAERAGLEYVKGCGEEILSDFYRLLMITRRRHLLVPQPLGWFRNLIACMDGGVAIRVARKDGIPVAALFTLRHRDVVVYKYGCSDERCHHLGGMPFLFWKLIEESKAGGAQQIDFGRTDLDNDGLIRFKDQFGTVRRQITYLRYPESTPGKVLSVLARSAPRRLFSVLPAALSSRAGKLWYRHLG